MAMLIEDLRIDPRGPAGAAAEHLGSPRALLF